MKIDILKAKQTFKEYVKNYNPEDEKVKLKISHIERVSQIAREIAEEQNLSQEDIELAELIGLLHDIGRFEQIKQYNTFVDKDSINHGEYGVQILFEKGLIREFIKSDKFDEIIKLAILNHNRAKIEKGLTKREFLHAQIIRDADKTDIFYVLTVEEKKAIWESSDLSNDTLTDEIYREFMEDRVMNYQKRKTSVDILVSHFAFVYDLNFKYSLKILKENNYLDKIYNRFVFNNKETKERMEKIYKTAKKYIKEKG